MSRVIFEWDPGKHVENQRKHGVSFEEAHTTFLDDHAREFFDPDHSDEEDRLILLGISVKLRVLVVCHCVRKCGSVIRIISARKANTTEEKDYWRMRR